MWQAPLTLFLLYRELFSDSELFTDHELREARTPRYFTTLPSFAAVPYVMHALHVASSACSFSIVP